MSCNYQTLFSGNYGYVVVCNECNTYQLAFLSSLISFTSAQYQYFQSQVKSEIDKNNDSLQVNCKSVVLNTADSSVRLLLTPSELAELNTMLEHADTEARTAALLQLFA